MAMRQVEARRGGDHWAGDPFAPIKKHASAIVLHWEGGLFESVLDAERLPTSPHDVLPCGRRPRGALGRGSTGGLRLDDGEMLDYQRWWKTESRTGESRTTRR